MKFTRAAWLPPERRRRAPWPTLCWPALAILPILSAPGMTAAAAAGVTDAPCPQGAIAIEPGGSIQAAVDRADAGAAFCLKNGVQIQHGQKHGECVRAAPACDLPGWTMENCEVCWNIGAGISVGTGGRVRGCNIHHNGQIGIEGNGQNVSIEGNSIWSNNIYGFDYICEAGGVKIALSDGVTYRGNHIYDNVGPGLWCDIDCRNVVYDGNLVENNHDIGIFHEISFKAVIRNNVVRHNGRGHRGWFWRAEVGVAA